MADGPYHFPPDLLDAVVDAIPLITRTKRDVLNFFRGCGVDSNYLRTLEGWTAQEAGRSKYHIAREVLIHLNELGDKTLGQRREVLKRVAGFEDFSSCYPDNQLKARGAVAAVAQLVNQKDSFTRIQNLKDEELRHFREQRSKEAEAARARREARDLTKQDFYRLFGSRNPQRRGSDLEEALARLFAAHDIEVKEAFTVTAEARQGVIEQIDGAVVMAGRLYLVEMKWWADKLGRSEVAPLLVSVYNRPDVGGIMVSASGFHDSAIADFRSALTQRTVIMVELQELVLALEQDRPLLELLMAKVRHAQMMKNPLHRPFVE